MSVAPPPAQGLPEFPLPPPPPTPQPRSFEQLAALRDEEIDVALGAAFIAKDAYAGLDVSALLARFDALAAPIANSGLATLPPDEQARRLSEFIYGTLGFRGNEAEYYDPRNSLLPDVLDRKLGIPITLALVYVEIARRCGVRARGVGFPGHFLVRIDPAHGAPVFVDPFFGGRTLDRAGLERLLRRSAGAAEALKDEHLAAANARACLVRMLINLKWIHTTRGDFARALLALDRIVSLTPNNAAALRERGLLAARLGVVETARADLAKLLELDPNLADAKTIRARLTELQAKKPTLN